MALPHESIDEGLDWERGVIIYHTFDLHAKIGMFL